MRLLSKQVCHPTRQLEFHPQNPHISMQRTNSDLHTCAYTHGTHIHSKLMLKFKCILRVGVHACNLSTHKTEIGL